MSVNGLNYEALSSQPARGVLVELVDASNRIITSGVTDAEGRYNLSASLGQNLRVRAKAQLINGVDDAGEWDIRVTDNTSNNRLYAMVGDLLAVSETTAQRNLHAPSGWSGQAYTEPRIAAPFAIIDSVYLGLQRILAANSSVQLSRMEFRWSANNNTASGELSLGEIGTSFYRSDLNAIYVLGAADEDTDEYDRHVILHEWGHYIEAELSRSDSIGGAHSGSDKLDFRVAMSEGFANAFSAMLLDDPLYRDSSGFAQQDGFNIDVERLNNAVRGWYSEDSVQSVVYNFYTSANNKTARNFADVFNTITRSSYINSDAFVSIYLFAEELRAELPTAATALDTLLTGQNIAVTNRFGAGESNSGGMSRDLPVYKTLQPNNVAVNVCSTNLNGSYNKLGGSQFFRLDILSAGRYQISATESQSNLEDSDPDLYLYRRGQFIAAAESANADSETLTQSLEPGVYVLEVTDARTTDESSSDAITACFDVRLVAN